jgi:3-isopropylmalate/(R)-2-methylmalate dehydratase large subunit
VVDHIISTLPGRTGESHPPGRERIHALRANAREFDVPFFDTDNPQQGIVHVVAPELGFTLPGTTVVCGDSHTATNGALGALAWGIGTTEVMHVMAAQALLLHRPKRMRVTFTGTAQPGVFAKDLVLAFIRQNGVTTGKGYAVEYAGPVIAALGMEARMTICNMSIEFGARMGLMGVDDTTLAYVHGRQWAPAAQMWDRAAAQWRTLRSDDDAVFDRELSIDCTRVAPQISWGTKPEDMADIDGMVPEPGPGQDAMRRSLDYMGLTPGQRLEGVPVDYAFIGSCTNSRLSDLQEAAAVLRGRKVADGVKALAVPGSMTVKAEAEALGLDRVFIDAGFEWRNAGCSMCVASNGDMVLPGRRSISTTNRNFQDRQGPGSRTHLASPASVAAAAVSGHIADVRKLMRN